LGNNKTVQAVTCSGNDVITERRRHMAKTITWEKEFGQVLVQARAQNKMVLLDFFNPL
jgi:hypothetical protein